MIRRLLPSAALLLLAGCSHPGIGAGGQVVVPDVATTPPTSRIPTSTPTQVVPSGFNPCYKLDVDAIAAVAGVALSKNTGAIGAQRCGLIPAARDDPAFTVTYQPFQGSLDEVLTSIGEDPKRVVRPDIAHADSAALILNVDDTQAFATGFVKIGDLVEVVNGADPPPNDVPALVHATELILTELAAAAPTAGS